MKEGEILPALNGLSAQYVQGLERRRGICRSSETALSLSKRGDKEMKRAAFRRAVEDRRDLKTYVLAGLDVLGFDPHPDVLSLAIIHMAWPDTPAPTEAAQ